MSLGPVQFNYAVNPQTYSERGEASFAKHEVIGTRPVREVTGLGDETMTIAGEVHPYHFGGLAGLRKLQGARVASLPMPFMSGLLRPLGWYLIEELEYNHEQIGPQGVGTVIKFTAKLVKANAPASSGAAALLEILL
jgi:phage protein U